MPCRSCRYTLRISSERARGGDRLRLCTIGPLPACAAPTAADSDSATGSRAAPLYGASACCRSAPAPSLGGKGLCWTLDHAGQRQCHWLSMSRSRMACSRGTSPNLNPDADPQSRRKGGAPSEMSRSRVACSRNVPITIVAKPHISVTTCGPVCGSCAYGQCFKRTKSLTRVHSA